MYWYEIIPFELLTPSFKIFTSKCTLFFNLALFKSKQISSIKISPIDFYLLKNISVLEIRVLTLTQVYIYLQRFFCWVPQNWFKKIHFQILKIHMLSLQKLICLRKGQSSTSPSLLPIQHHISPCFQ